VAELMDQLGLAGSVTSNRSPIPLQASPTPRTEVDRGGPPQSLRCHVRWSVTNRCCVLDDDPPNGLDNPGPLPACWTDPARPGPVGKPLLLVTHQFDAYHSLGKSVAACCCGQGPCRRMPVSELLQDGPPQRPVATPLQVCTAAVITGAAAGEAP